MSVAVRPAAILCSNRWSSRYATGCRCSKKSHRLSLNEDAELVAAYRLTHDKKVAAHRPDNPVLGRIPGNLRAQETVD